MIKKMEIPTTAFGLNPFTTLIIRTVRKAAEDSKTGFSTSIWLNKETGVQVAYIASKTRFYNMANPAENAEYWRIRAAVKRRFIKSMGW